MRDIKQEQLNILDHEAIDTDGKLPHHEILAKKHYQTNNNSPNRLELDHRPKVSQTSSSTHLFHYGERSIDSRGRKTK